MLSSKIKDLKKRKIFLKIEKKKYLYKFLFINFFFKKKKSIKLLKYINKKKLISKTKIKNRCVYTNRSRGVSKYFSLSRISQKNFMEFGLIPGFIKAVW